MPSWTRGWPSSRRLPAWRRPSCGWGAGNTGVHRGGGHGGPPCRRAPRRGQRAPAGPGPVLGPPAPLAQPVHVGPVARDRVPAAPGHGGGPVLDLARGDGHHPAASLADEVVVVGGLAQLVGLLALAGGEGLGDPRAGQGPEGPVHGGQAGSVPDLFVEVLRGHRPVLAVEGLDDGHPLGGGPQAGQAGQRRRVAHASLLGTWRTAVRRPTAANARNAAMAVRTMVPPGISSPCQAATANPVHAESAPTSTAHPSVARNEWATFDPAATGITISAATSRSPTTRIPPTTSSEVRVTSRRLRRSTGRPAALAVSSSRATARRGRYTRRTALTTSAPSRAITPTSAHDSAKRLPNSTDSTEVSNRPARLRPTAPAAMPR